jgi:RNA polymerase sigma-70 factor, ECF subfamily
VAFEELVRRHAEGLHRVVSRLVASRAEAEEVTQEAFLRAWRGIERFHGDARFFTWLYRIGVNEARRRNERRPADVASGLGHPGAGEVPDVRADLDERDLSRDLRAALEEAVRALPFEYRAPLILRDVEGLTTAEAADVLGLGEAAFKSRLHRARLAVREAIAPQLEPERRPDA